MTTAPQETIDYVEQIANQGQQILMVEEESAEELQGVLNLLNTQGYGRVIGFSTAGIRGDIHHQWRYTAVVRKTGPTNQEVKIPQRLRQRSQS